MGPKAEGLALLVIHVIVTELGSRQYGVSYRYIDIVSRHRTTVSTIRPVVSEHLKSIHLCKPLFSEELAADLLCIDSFAPLSELRAFSNHFWNAPSVARIVEFQVLQPTLSSHNWIVVSFIEK